MDEDFTVDVVLPHEIQEQVEAGVLDDLLSSSDPVVSRVVSARLAGAMFGRDLDPVREAEIFGSLMAFAGENDIDGKVLLAVLSEEAERLEQLGHLEEACRMAYLSEILDDGMLDEYEWMEGSTVNSHS